MLRRDLPPQRSHHRSRYGCRHGIVPLDYAFQTVPRKPPFEQQGPGIIVTLQKTYRPASAEQGQCICLAFQFFPRHSEFQDCVSVHGAYHRHHVVIAQIERGVLHHERPPLTTSPDALRKPGQPRRPGVTVDVYDPSREIAGDARGGSLACHRPSFVVTSITPFPPRLP